MRTTVKLILLALTVSVMACSKSNDDNVTPDNSTNKVEQVSGDWTVTYFTDSGKDETSDFSGYRFAFGTDGILTATGSAGTYTGTWWIGDKSGDDDNSSNRLNIVITGNKAMDHIQDDWVIISISNTEIRLKDDNPASMEELHFGRTNQS
jgi:hypothetical protein